MSSITSPTLTQPPVEYPESDGEPMAENTLQFDWIVRIKEGIDDLFRDDPLVFVAGDLLWYPVEGEPQTRAAPDTMVVFGRPKGHRGCYKQWEEDGLAPQVVFEVLSPGNRAGELLRKLAFYEQHGVEEYYQYDPDRLIFRASLRQGDRLVELDAPDGWVSARLSVRFDLSNGELVMYRPDGKPLLNYSELALQFEAANREREAANREREALALENERLRAKLREVGLD